MDNVTQQLLRTAELTNIDNKRRTQRRMVDMATDADDRAFYAERAKADAELALQDERDEHDLTKRALKQLLAQNIGMEKTLRHLASRWAPQEGKTPEDLTQNILKKSEAMAEALQADTTNTPKFERDANILREAQRIVPKRRKPSP